MQNLHPKLSRILPVLFSPLMNIRSKKGFIYLLFIFAGSLSSCFETFYKAGTRSSIDTTALSKLISDIKYFIIHSNNGINGLENAYVKNDSLFGGIVTVPLEHTVNLHIDSADNE